MKNVPNVYIENAKVLGFSEWEIFRRIYLPASLPQIFTGVVTGYGISWFVLTAAEFLASTDGLGYMIWTASRLGRSDLIVLGMILIGLIGSVLTTIIGRVESYLIRYRTA
jgi:ABC-type nitrate/sulfonate/bicarbonate transport system permease component